MGVAALLDPLVEKGAVDMSLDNSALDTPPLLLLALSAKAT